MKSLLILPILAVALMSCHNSKDMPNTGTDKQNQQAQPATPEKPATPQGNTGK